MVLIDDSFPPLVIRHLVNVYKKSADLFRTKITNEQTSTNGSGR